MLVKLGQSALILISKLGFFLPRFIVRKNMKNFIGLKPGDCVTHVAEPNVTYTVLANFGTRVTCVALADMTNPHEWECVSKPVPACDATGPLVSDQEAAAIGTLISFRGEQEVVFVICQNDFPYCIYIGTEAGAREACKQLELPTARFKRRIYYHYHHVPLFKAATWTEVYGGKHSD